MGVPQGSVLSVTLLALKINSIVKAISPGVECSLYVHDFLIVYRSLYIHIIERHLQRSLNMLSHWADTNGFKFSSSKTVCMHFFRLRIAHPNPELTLNGTLIPVVEQTKLLGVIFDNKLTFFPHIRYLKEKSLTLPGEPTSTRCYISIDRLFVLSSTMAVLSMVLREILCLGAFRTSPASSMCVQANEPPLNIRQRMLSIQYSLRLGSSPSNPAYNTVFSPKFKAYLSSKPNQIPTLGIRIAPELEKIGFMRNTVSRLSVPATPPWLLRHPEIELSLHSSDKAVTPPEVLIVMVQQASSMQNFTLSCLPWMLSEDLKKNTLSCCQTHIQV